MEQLLIENDYLRLTCLPYGAIIKQLEVKKNNEFKNVVIGYDQPDDYANNPLFYGASLGRYAGRIGNKGFSLQGQSYTLNHLENGVTLHGGQATFSHKSWSLDGIIKNSNPSITFSYNSNDLEEGFPGNVKATVTYQLLKNKLKISYKANTDKTTIINLANHSYFNLDGEGSVLEHELELKSNQFLEVDEKQIPTGNFKEVNNTAFDFVQKRKIKDNNFKGVDDCFVMNNGKSCATLYSESSGIEMKVSTNQPGIVIFTPSEIEHKPYNNGAVFEKFPAICFETQNYPDAPNHSHFPSAVLQPEDTYLNESTFEFNIK
ncbi:aldose epimerase family protein [Zhouia sp. PK063]|uniref:aldose epimerase family protein n=1 Tax=Zhouia sp. PK063 TaxID=3373602 RepID=UPI0037BB5D09